MTPWDPKENPPGPCTEHVHSDHGAIVSFFIAFRVSFTRGLQRECEKTWSIEHSRELTNSVRGMSWPAFVMFFFVLAFLAFFWWLYVGLAWCWGTLFYRGDKK